MKKIILSAAMLLCGAAAFAQSGFSFGIGYAQTMEWGKYELAAYNTEKYNETFSGFYIQGGYDIEVSDIFAVVPQINFVSAWSTIPANYMWAGNAAGTRQYWTLNVPIYLKAAADFSGNVRGFLMAGPSLSIGLVSRDRIDGVVINYYGEGQSSYSRWNVGVSAALGIDLNERNRFNLGYTYNFLDTCKISGVTDHMGFLTIGYALLMF